MWLWYDCDSRFLRICHSPELCWNPVELVLITYFEPLFACLSKNVLKVRKNHIIPILEQELVFSGLVFAYFLPTTNFTKVYTQCSNKEWVSNEGDDWLETRFGCRKYEKKMPSSETLMHKTRKCISQISFSAWTLETEIPKAQTEHFVVPRTHDNAGNDCTEDLLVQFKHWI